MKGQSIIAGNSIATHPTNKAAAAGPITITTYKHGKPVSKTVLPAPGDQYSAPKKLPRAITVSPHKQSLNDSYVSPATQAKRRAEAPKYKGD